MNALSISRERREERYQWQQGQPKALTDHLPGKVRGLCPGHRRTLNSDLSKKTVEKVSDALFDKQLAMRSQKDLLKTYAPREMSYGSWRKVEEVARQFQG